MDDTIDKKYRFTLLDDKFNLTDENIKNFINASYQLYIDFSNNEVWYSKNKKWMSEVFKIRSEGNYTTNTNYFKFLKYLFYKIHYGVYSNKFEFLKQLLMTLEEQSITGIYVITNNKKLIDFLTCNPNRKIIFLFNNETSISNTQLLQFIELKEQRNDPRCESIDKYKNLTSYISRPLNKTKRILSLTSLNQNKKPKMEGGKTKKQRKKKLSKKRL